MACVCRIMLLMVTLLLCGLTKSSHYEEFILDGRLARVVRSAAGELRAVVGSPDENRPLWEHDVSIGFISMEPKALLLPHYLDAAAILLVLQGEAKVTWFHGKDVASQPLRTGDVFTLPAGDVFHIINSNDEDNLEIISMMDTSTSLRKARAQHFFVGGGIDPAIVLSGFRAELIAAAFKVSRDEVLHFFSSQRQGPIIHTTVQLSEASENKGDKHSKKHKKGDKGSKKDKKADEEKEASHDDKREHEDEKHVTNLFDRHTFSSEHGWLSTSGRLAGRVEAFAVHLDAGSMMAPYWNPRGCEFGIVTRGYGSIQIVRPNGISAADEPLKVGTVFYVPPFHPVTQIAATNSSLEFVGFSVVSDGMEDSQAQFLAGNKSILRKIDLSILALSLDVPESLVGDFLDAQSESIILPVSNSQVQLAEL